MRCRAELVVVLMLAACRAPDAVRTGPSPIRTVRVETFRCEDPVTGEAVRNVFLGMLAEESRASVVREGAADVVVEGTVTMLTGAAGESRATVVGVAGTAASQASGGRYVGGVTALALRDGTVLTSASRGQTLGDDDLRSSEQIARDVADRLVDELRERGLAR